MNANKNPGGDRGGGTAGTDDPHDITTPTPTQSLLDSVPPMTYDERILSDVDPYAIEDDGTHYAIAPIIPRGHVTLLGGHGGAGKSMLALTLAAHVASGTRWAGLDVARGRACYVSLEDPGRLMRSRLHRIAESYGIAYDDIVGRLRMLDGSGRDSALVTEAAYGGVRDIEETLALGEVTQAAIGCTMIIIDGASHAYDADENSRRLVRKFISRLARLADDNDCAIVLVAHVDKTAARYGAAGETYSGSTSWHNIVRSRIAISMREERTTITLLHEKSNLARSHDPIPLTWSDDGVLIPLEGAGTSIIERDAQDDADVLAAVSVLISGGATVYAARTGSHSTISVLRTCSAMPDHLTTKAGVGRAWAAIDRLVCAGALVRESYRTPQRRDSARLVLRASLPHTPSALTRAGGRAGAHVPGEHYPRTTRAPAQITCLRCAGTGCEWCQTRGPLTDSTACAGSA